MKRLILLLSAVGFAGCGEKPAESAKPATIKPPVVAPPPAPKADVKSDPNGKNTCITCTLKTNEANCPKCKAPLKAAAVAAPSTAPKPSGDVGKSTVSGLYACPEPGCTFAEPKKGTCIKHATTQLKEQWFVCDKCGKKEPVAGKCAGCGADLTRKLQ
jgi:hypothetical protein